MSTSTLEEMRKDLSLVDNKFTETAKIAAIATKYGIKQAGRQKMSAEVAKLIVEKIRVIRQIAANS